MCASAVVIALAMACDDSEVACKVDVDCPQGNICREGHCGPPSSSEAGAATIDSGTTCTSEGLACGSPDDCCSRTCTDSRCGAPGAPPSPTCKGLYEICQGDCCSGLTCTAGACR